MAELVKITETQNEGLKRAYTVVVASNLVEGKIESRLAEIGKTAKMAGFRPGKIPQAVLKKRYGQSVVGEVLQETIAETSQKLLNDRKIRPSLQPSVEITAYDQGKDLEYKVSLEMFPETPEVKFEEISLERLKAEVTDKDIQEGLERVQKANRSFEKSEATSSKADQGDVVVIDFVGKVGGEAFEGGTAEGFRLELGSGQFIEGFEAQLTGSKVGDEVAVKVTFPDPYHSETLAGKPAVFDVTVKEILKPAIPALDDTFATKIGFESLEKLKEAVQQQIEKDYAELSRSRVKKDLFDILDKSYPFDVPQGMVELEFKSLLEQVSRNKATDPELKDKSEEELKTEMHTMADRRVRLGILLAEIGRRQDIQVEQDELRKAVYDQARMFPGQERKVIEFYQKHRDSLEQLKGPILEEKVVDFLLEKVKTKEKVVSSKELLDYFSSETE